ncbi:MAG: DNRLRE domain-containing protein [Cyclobacteriaceae bacterium]
MNKNLFFSLALLSLILFSSCKKELITTIFDSDPDNGKDALIWTEEPDKNYGNSTAFFAIAWTWYGDGYDDDAYRSFIEFPLERIPPKSKVCEAKLILHFYEGSYFTDRYHNYEENSAKIQMITENWEEHTITWNNQPSVSDQNQVLLASTIDTPYQDYEIDITDIVRSQLKTSNYGVRISLQNEDHYRGVVMSSSDHELIELRPQLKITYIE